MPAESKAGGMKRQPSFCKTQQKRRKEKLAPQCPGDKLLLNSRPSFLRSRLSSALGNNSRQYLTATAVVQLFTTSCFLANAAYACDQS